MNEQQILLAFGGIGAAALGCQWLAWRLKLPAILFLLLLFSGPQKGPALRPGPDDARRDQPAA